MISLRKATIPVMCTAEKTTMVATASAMPIGPGRLAADAPDGCEKGRGQQDDDRDARHVPEQGRADIIDAAAPGDVVGGRQRIDDSDHKATAATAA